MGIVSFCDKCKTISIDESPVKLHKIGDTKYYLCTQCVKDFLNIPNHKELV